jgi:hypothetical protein
VAVVGLQVAGGHHAGQGDTGGALGDAEQLAGAHQQAAGQPGRLCAEQGRGDDRSGRERPLVEDITGLHHVYLSV